MAPSRPPRPPPRPARDPKDILKKRGADLIRKVSDRDRYAIFLEPVDLDLVDGYADVIARPMDLSTTQKNLQLGVYRTPIELRADLDLIWSNCCTFNDDRSIYFKEAVRLRSLTSRYYDDFIRALTRDGVAPALGIPTPRPIPPRPAHKRLPPSRYNQSHSQTPAPSPSPQPSELDSDPDPSPTPSASPSASASAAHMPTFHDTQLRRARALRDSAIAAVKTATEEVRSASLAAGIAPPGHPSQQQIFNGPGAILSKPRGSTPLLSPKQFPVASNPQIRDRCANIPTSWKRIGRWHPRGATLSKFLSKERALDLRYGRQYDKFVRKSAPLARRILATVLDPQVVQLHDMCIMAQVDPRRHQALSGLTHDGSSVVPTSRESSDSSLSVAKLEDKQNGTRPNHHTNGIHVKMDIDENPATDNQVNGAVVAPKTARRPRAGRNPSPMAVISPAKPVNGRSEGILSNTHTPKKTVNLVRRNGEHPPTSPGGAISQDSISGLQELLNKHGIDSGFINGLMKGAKHNTDVTPKRQTYSQFVQNNTSLHGRLNKADNEELADLLSSNHSTVMNVLRIRALREKASEALDEELESQERDYVEALTKGISLAVQNIPPEVVIHPVDAAETAMEMSFSVLPQDPKPVPK